MKFVLYLCFLLIMVGVKSQNPSFPVHLQKTNIAKLQSGDSLIFYQCHVDEAKQELTTSSGQKITSKAKQLTITEKFTIYRNDSVYTCKYFVSPLTNYPNKKFPYLTLKEVANWDFELKASKPLPLNELHLLSAFENKTHSITHYELNVNKSCPNEVVIKGKHMYEQLLVEGNYLMREFLKFN